MKIEGQVGFGAAWHTIEIEPWMKTVEIDISIATGLGLTFVGDEKKESFRFSNDGAVRIE